MKQGKTNRVLPRKCTGHSKNPLPTTQEKMSTRPSTNQLNCFNPFFGVTGKFGLGMWNEAGQRLIEFCQENTLVIANTLFQQEDSTHGHHQMVNTEIRLIIFFAAKDGYTVSKNKTGS